MALVFDVTDESSFDHLEDWIKRLQDQGPDKLVLCLIANKIDLSDERKILKEEAEKKAEELSACFQETSSFIDYGVNDVFTKMVEAYDKEFYAFGRGKIGEGGEWDEGNRKQRSGKKGEDLLREIGQKKEGKDSKMVKRRRGCC